MTGLILRLRERKIAFREHVHGSVLTTLRIGGDCPLVIEPQCAGELQTAARLCRDNGVRFDVIGGGSNLLISDKGVPWAVISTRKMQGITCRGGALRAMCGVPLPLLLQAFAKAGDNSLLFAAGIPGTVGGALYMNAGTEGHGVLDTVYSVCVIDADTLEFKTVFQKECNKSYRNSDFQANNDLIVSADFPLHGVCEPEDVFGEIRARLAARKAVQPLEYPNAGSTFKRHDPAGKGIDPESPGAALPPARRTGASRYAGRGRGNFGKACGVSGEPRWCHGGGRDETDRKSAGYCGKEFGVSPGDGDPAAPGSG